MKRSKIKVYCDECGKSFIIKMKKEKVDIGGENVERVYYVCPYCYKDFLVSLKDREINRLLGELKTYFLMSRDVMSRYKMIDNLSGKIKIKERRLRAKWEKMEKQKKQRT